jgi:hypothetical protein
LSVIIESLRTVRILGEVARSIGMLCVSVVDELRAVKILSVIVVDMV